MFSYRTLQNYGLGAWLSDLQSNKSHSNITLIFYIFFAISVFITTIAVAFYTAIISVRGAIKLHNNMIRNIMFAPLSWYDSTPLGRITNRLSQDISTIDKDLMNNLRNVLLDLMGLIQVIVIISITVTLLLIPLLPILLFTFWVAYKYIHVSRELKRLESIHKSPVFVLFSESLQGLSIIRSFQSENRFFTICCNRLNTMNRCHLYLWICNRWLNFRMQMLGSLVAGGTALLVVLQAKSLNGTTAGLALIYALMFTDNLTYLIRNHAECQMNLNSVERIQEYSQIASEKYHVYRDNGSEDVTSIIPEVSGVEINWPSKGEIEFDHIRLKYASSSNYVLR